MFNSVLKRSLGRLPVSVHMEDFVHALNDRNLKSGIATEGKLEIMEITKENLAEFVEKAKETKKKADRVKWSTVVIYYAVAVPVLFFGLSPWGYFVVATSPPMSPETAFATIIVSFVFFYQMIVILLLLLTEIGMKYVFGLKYEDWVFGELILIVNFLRNADKIEAIKEVDVLTAAIRGFMWDSRRNSRGKMLSTEFNTLKNGAKQIKRMLLFSKRDPDGMITRFALAFIQNQDSKTFSTIKDIIEEAALYGEMQGFAQRVAGRIERYPTVLAITWAAVSTIISIVLAIMLKMNV